MATMITVVSLDGAGMVCKVARLGPGRLFSDRNAVWMVEMAGAVEHPRVGRALVAEPMLRRWPEP